MSSISFFRFNSSLSNDGHGLSVYDDDYGLWMISLFEPIYARRLFPCFDEPRWKSTFRLQLWLIGDRFVLVDGNMMMMALSNTNGERTVCNDQLVIWQFEQTRPLPTYLLTIAIGQFRSECRYNTSCNRSICLWRFAQVYCSSKNNSCALFSTKSLVIMIIYKLFLAFRCAIGMKQPNR
jgi:aminopeptidase N